MILLCSIFIDNTMFTRRKYWGGISFTTSSFRNLASMVDWMEKLHGIKWQTSILANHDGMNLNSQIWGPISVRRKDITSLVNSKFGGLLEEFIADFKVKFKCQCDSAYINSKFLSIRWWSRNGFRSRCYYKCWTMEMLWLQRETKNQKLSSC